MSIPKIAAALAVGALAVAGAAQASDQNPAKGTPDATPAAGPALDGKLPDAGLSPNVAARPPRGYIIVSSGTLNSPAGSQVHGSRACPAGSSVLGGGVFVTSGSTSVNVNSSYPSGNGWAADVNNGSGAATTFSVYAVCGNTPRKYSIVAGPLTNVPAGSQIAGIAATCPSATAPALSGGAFSDTFSTLANINSSIPATSGWRIDANNGSGGLEHVRAYAVCGKLRGYHVALSDSTFNGSGTRTDATAFCGTGVPVGGGSFSGSGSTAVSVNTSYPVSGGWRAYMNNASASGEVFRTYAVCAGQ